MFPLIYYRSTHEEIMDLASAQPIRLLKGLRAWSLFPQ
jgi:hypothetical protein